MRQLLSFGAGAGDWFVDCLLILPVTLHFRRLVKRVSGETIRPMTPQEYCAGWRQVRVFITAPVSDAFHIFHYSHTIPHLQAGGLNTPFFVSHYICGDEDSADTDIGQLPPNLRSPNGPNNTVHASIRFRFRETGGIEQGLNNIIPGNC
jgi:hypothetical protein